MYILNYNTNSCLLGHDARGHKRERDRARWQAMSKEERDEQNKKRRGAYHIRKVQCLKIKTTNEGLLDYWCLPSQ